MVGLICPLIEIGLTDLQKSRGRGDCPPAPLVPMALVLDKSKAKFQVYSCPLSAPGGGPKGGG